MPDPVDLYDRHYGEAGSELYAAIRRETFDEDLGQTSWLTAAECDGFGERLGLDTGKRLLEVACGTGGVAVRLAQRAGVDGIGIDRHEAAVAAAKGRAAAAGLDGRLGFRVGDADETLAFEDGSFDALLCNDAVNHFRDRARVLAQWHRVLKPGGRCVYTDPVVVTGCVAAEELAARSSIGHFVFTAPGANEALLRASGFRVVAVEDGTENVAQVSRSWQDARERRRRELLEHEGEARFAAFQRFLATVHALAAERRLSRHCYVAEK